MTIDVNFSQLVEKDKEWVVRTMLKVLDDCRSIYDLKRTICVYEVGEVLADEKFGRIFKRGMGKIMQDIYKYTRNAKMFDSHPKVINQGTRYTSDSGESWRDWYIFDAQSEEEVLNIINSSKGYIYVEPDTFHSTYDCTGRMFSYEMRIAQIAPNRFFAIKWHGLDV